jgi:hypothetical protein
MREMSARPERAQRFFAWVVAHRLIVVATAAALLGICAVGARNVQVDYTIEQLFPARGETRALFEEYKRAFPREDTRFSLVWKDSRPPGVALFRDMQRAADQFEAVGLRDVHWIGSVNVVEPEAIDGELGLRVHSLIEEDRLSDDYVRRELARHRSENLYRGYLWNADQTAFAIHGYLDEDHSDDRSRRDIDGRRTRDYSWAGVFCSSWAFFSFFSGIRATCCSVSDPRFPPISSRLRSWVSRESPSPS